MNKYNNEYRSESLRLQGYDYSSKGIYFITICTYNRVPYFGTISDGKMTLSGSGRIITNEWQQTGQICDRVILGEWVVMPNHFHALIYLKPKTGGDASHASYDTNFKDGFNQDGFNPSLQENGAYKNSFGPQKDNISSIIRGFKSTCTRQIRESFIPDFEWQSKFHDHILRNQKSLIKIEQYIRENPTQWHDDRFHV